MRDASVGEFVEFGPVHRLALLLVDQHGSKRLAARNAAGVCRQNAIGTALHLELSSPAYVFEFDRANPSAIVGRQARMVLPYTRIGDLRRQRSAVRATRRARCRELLLRYASFAQGCRTSAGVFGTLQSVNRRAKIARRIKDCQAHGVQTRQRRSENMATIEGGKSVAQGRPRRQIPKRHRGHQKPANHAA